MIPYLGDFAEDDTVDIIFNAFTSNDPSASATITNFVNTDVHIHKDLGLTQRNNAAGITVSVDFDGITGNHAVKIDTSDDTIGGFWVTGSEYQVRIEGTTVDGAIVNAWIGSFSIERAGGTVALLKLIQAAVITNAAGADVAADIIAVKAETATIVNDTDVIDDGTSGLVKIASDIAAVLVDTAVIGALGVGLTAVPWNSDWDAEVQSECADALAAYDPPTKAEMDTGHGLLATEAKQDTIDTVVDGIQTDLDNVTDGLGALKALIDAVDTVADAIKAKTDNLPADPADDSDIDTQLAAIAGYLDTEIAAIKAVTDNLPDAGALTTIGTDTARLTAVRAAVLTDWINGGRLDLLLDAIKVVTDALTSASATKLALSAGVIVAGTVSWDNTNATTTVIYCDDITEATADHFNGRIMIFTSGALQYQATDITDYALDTGEGKFTVTALTEAPADNVTFIIV